MQWFTNLYYNYFILLLCILHFNKTSKIQIYFWTAENSLKLEKGSIVYIVDNFTAYVLIISLW